MFLKIFFSGDIWTALPIFTYQQIAQRLTHAHVNGSEFRTIVAIYGSYRRSGLRVQVNFQKFYIKNIFKPSQ